MRNLQIELGHIVGTPGWAYVVEIAESVLKSIERELVSYDGANAAEITARHARANGSRKFWEQFQAEISKAAELDTPAPDSFGTPRY